MAFGDTPTGQQAARELSVKIAQQQAASGQLQAEAAKQQADNEIDKGVKTILGYVQGATQLGGLATDVWKTSMQEDLYAANSAKLKADTQLTNQNLKNNAIKEDQERLAYYEKQHGIKFAPVHYLEHHHRYAKLLTEQRNLYGPNGSAPDAGKWGDFDRWKLDHHIARTGAVRPQVIQAFMGQLGQPPEQTPGADWSGRDLDQIIEDITTAPNRFSEMRKNTQLNDMDTAYWKSKRDAIMAEANANGEKIQSDQLIEVMNDLQEALKNPQTAPWALDEFFQALGRITGPRTHRMAVESVNLPDEVKRREGWLSKSKAKIVAAAQTSEEQVDETLANVAALRALHGGLDPKFNDKYFLDGLIAGDAADEEAGVGMKYDGRNILARYAIDAQKHAYKGSNTAWLTKLMEGGPLQPEEIAQAGHILHYPGDEDLKLMQVKATEQAPKTMLAVNTYLSGQENSRFQKDAHFSKWRPPLQLNTNESPAANLTKRMTAGDKTVNMQSIEMLERGLSTMALVKFMATTPSQPGEYVAEGSDRAAFELLRRGGLLTQAQTKELIELYRTGMREDYLFKGDRVEARKSYSRLLDELEQMNLGNYEGIRVDPTDIHNMRRDYTAHIMWNHGMDTGFSHPLNKREAAQNLRMGIESEQRPNDEGNPLFAMTRDETLADIKEAIAASKEWQAAQDERVGYTRQPDGTFMMKNENGQLPSAGDLFRHSRVLGRLRDAATEKLETFKHKDTPLLTPEVLINIVGKDVFENPEKATLAESGMLREFFYKVTQRRAADRRAEAGEKGEPMKTEYEGLQDVYDLHRFHGISDNSIGKKIIDASNNLDNPSHGLSEEIGVKTETLIRDQALRGKLIHEAIDPSSDVTPTKLPAAKKVYMHNAGKPGEKGEKGELGPTSFNMMDDDPAYEQAVSQNTMGSLEPEEQQELIGGALLKLWFSEVELERDPGNRFAAIRHDQMISDFANALAHSTNFVPAPELVKFIGDDWSPSAFRDRGKIITGGGLRHTILGEINAPGSA